MAVERFDMDNDRDYARFTSRLGHTPQVLPRKHTYGSDGARADGLEPFGEYPDYLISEDDFKEALEYAHSKKSLPVYHQHNTWAPPGFRWNQNGQPLCWAWAAIAALLDKRAVEGKPTVLLAPITLGEVVNWRSVGYYLEDTARFLAEVGVAPASCVPDDAWHTLNPRRFDDCWSTERAKYKVGRRWDGNPARMTQHSLSMLVAGVPLYAAWNHLSHAMEVCGMGWNPNVHNNLDWIIRNSHNNDDVIIMSGRRAEPDVVIGFVDTKDV